MNPIKDENNISIDTHAYDTQIKDLYKNYIKDDKENLIQPKNFKITLTEIYNVIISFPYDNILHNALQTLNLIASDIKNNYDNLNNINFEELLPHTWRFIKYYDRTGIYLFLEQLSEIITNGPCAQGRVTRVFQFYSSHMDSKDNIYKKCIKVKP